MLIGLTVVTGLVDAFSYLTLGHVFTANMTGNVVFVGFPLAGAKGFSVTASLWPSPDSGWAPSSAVDYGLATPTGGRLLSVSATVQLAFLAVSLGTVLVAAAPVGTAPALHPHRCARPLHGGPERGSSSPRRPGPHDDRADDDHHRSRARTADWSGEPGRILGGVGSP